MSEQIQTFKEIPPDLRLPYPDADYNPTLDGLTLITRSANRENDAIRVGFTPLSKGVLKTRDFGGGIPHVVMNHPDFLEKFSFLRDTEEREPFIYASPAGMNLIETLGTEVAMDISKNPESFPGVEIGRGSESIAKRITLAGNECILKTPNHEGINRLNSLGIAGDALPPNYLYKLQKTSFIGSLLPKLPMQPTNFVFSEPVKDYFAGKNFLVEDFVDGTSVADIVRHVDAKDADLDEQVLDRPLAYWKQWISEYTEYKDAVGERFFVASHSKHSSYFDLDLDTSNLLVRGFDKASGMPVISVIDQAPSPVIRGGDVGDALETMKNERYTKLKEKLADDDTLAFLLGISPPKVI